MEADQLERSRIGQLTYWTDGLSYNLHESNANASADHSSAAKGLDHRCNMRLNIASMPTHFGCTALMSRLNRPACWAPFLASFCLVFFKHS